MYFNLLSVVYFISLSYFYFCYYFCFCFYFVIGPTADLIYFWGPIEARISAQCRVQNQGPPQLCPSLFSACCHTAQRPASPLLLSRGPAACFSFPSSRWPVGGLVGAPGHLLILAGLLFLSAASFFLPRARHWSLHFTHAACMFQHVNDCRHAIAASLTPACFSSRPWSPATRLLPLCVTAPAC